MPPLLLDLPPDLLQHILSGTLLVRHLKSWKATCTIAAQAGRRALTKSTFGPSYVTRSVALVWERHRDLDATEQFGFQCGNAVNTPLVQAWLDWRRGPARSMFKEHTNAFVAGFEYWPREQLIAHGVPAISDVLRYMSRTRAPIGSDIGLQVLLAHLADWEDMELAWELLPAAMRRSGRPRLQELAPYLEDWDNVENICVILMRALSSEAREQADAPRRIPRQLHTLISELIESWEVHSMPKAAQVVVRLVAHHHTEEMQGGRVAAARAAALCFAKGGVTTDLAIEQGACLDAFFEAL